MDLQRNAMNVTKETLDLLKLALSNPNSDIAKAWTQSGSAISGITAYDLEPYAKLLFPVLTPLRNVIPRTSGKGGIQANWRAITGINTAKIQPGLTEGHRGGIISETTADCLAIYKELGLDNNVSMKADLAAEGFDDLKRITTQNLLWALMLAEEKTILAGQGTWSLATPALTLAGHTTGGALTYAHDPYSVYCVALTLDGYLNASVALGIPQTVTITTADGYSQTYNGGASVISSVAQASMGGSVTTGSITATVAAVPGAVAYAWYWGPTGTAAALGAITTVNTYLITTDVPTGTQLYSAVGGNYSANSLVFDGLLCQAAKTASGAYMKSLDGAALTANTVGGVTEIDDMLKSMWDNYRISPDIIYVSAQEKKNIRTKILTGSSSAAQRFVFESSQGGIVGGTGVVSYLNPFCLGASKEIPIEIHPDLPPGTLIAITHSLPYPLSNVANVIQMRCRRDYHSIEWPQVKRQYEYGVYMDGVLQHYFPPSMGVIYNILNG